MALFPLTLAGLHGEFADQTIVHPVGLTMLLLTVFASLVLPRRMALGCALAMPCFVSAIQQVVILGIDFSFTRILIITLLFRALIRGEYKKFLWHPMDGLIIAWSLSKIFCYTWLHGSGNALIFVLGLTVDSAGAYFALRFLLIDWEDISAIGKTYAVTAIILSVFFLIEANTRRNLFSVFGGVPEITIMRQGRLRCQGAFSHPIVAGSLWASMLPWFYGTFRYSRKGKFLIVLGVIASAIIIITCASSTPVFGGLMGALAVALWWVRRHIYLIVKGFFLSLFCLHMLMEAPVWHLMSRISAVGGSTGYHRYKLFDNFVNHFSEWALRGTRGTDHWGYYMFDITNHFVLEAVRGGLSTLVLFIAILIYAFKSIDRINRTQTETRKQILAWCLGACLVSHIASFFGISYFGQITIIFFLNLAAIASLNTTCQRERVQQQMAMQMMPPEYWAAQIPQYGHEPQQLVHR